MTQGTQATDDQRAASSSCVAVGAALGPVVGSLGNRPAGEDGERTWTLRRRAGGEGGNNRGIVNVGGGVRRGEAMVARRMAIAKQGVAPSVETQTRARRLSRDTEIVGVVQHGLSVNIVRRGSAEMRYTSVGVFQSPAPERCLADRSDTAVGAVKVVVVSHPPSGGGAARGYG